MVQITLLQYKKECPMGIFVKNNVMHAEFTETDVRGTKKLKGRQPSMASFLSVPKYQSKFPISLAKFNDLKKLCHKGVIPSEYHWF